MTLPTAWKPRLASIDLRSWSAGTLSHTRPDDSCSYIRTLAGWSFTAVARAIESDLLRKSAQIPALRLTQQRTSTPYRMLYMDSSLSWSAAGGIWLLLSNHNKHDP